MKTSRHSLNTYRNAGALHLLHLYCSLRGQALLQLMSQTKTQQEQVSYLWPDGQWMAELVLDSAFYFQNLSALPYTSLTFKSRSSGRHGEASICQETQRLSGAVGPAFQEQPRKPQGVVANIALQQVRSCGGPGQPREWGKLIELYQWLPHFSSVLVGEQMEQMRAATHVEGYVKSKHLGC